MLSVYVVALVIAAQPQPGRIGEAPVPPAVSAADVLAVGPYGSGGCGLWFFAPASSSMGCLSGERVLGYRISADASTPSAFAVDERGRVFFANPKQSRVEWMSPDGRDWGAIELEGRPISLTMGPRDEVWFATTDSIGNIDDHSHVGYFPTKTTAPPLSVSSSLGAPFLWIIENDPGTIGQLDSKGHLKEFPLSRCPRSTPGYGRWLETPSAVSDGNNLWFVRQCGDPSAAVAIVRVSSNGNETDYTARGIGSHRVGLALGTDEMWFTEFESSKIGRLESSGRITEYPTPSRDAGPTAIVEDSSRMLWFVESRLNKVGHFAIQPPLTR